MRTETKIKTLLILSFAIVIASVKTQAQPSPWYEATTGQVAAGVLGVPFVVTPRGLAGAGFFPGTNGGGSGIQTPWTSDINGAGFNLTNANSLVASTITTTTLIVTNLQSPTNVFTPTVVDMSKADQTVTMAGTLNLTAVSNVAAGVANGTILHVYPGGANRTVTVPASWHVTTSSTLVVSNTFNHSDFLIGVQPGLSTNVAQLDYK